MRAGADKGSTRRRKPGSLDGEGEREREREREREGMGALQSTAWLREDMDGVNSLLCGLANALKKKKKTRKKKEERTRMKPVITATTLIKN